MKQRKLVGIVSSLPEDNLSVGQNYFNWISYSLNMIPVIIDPTDQNVNTDIDLLVLPGGADVNPARYGGVLGRSVGFPNRAFEEFDFYMLQKYVETGIPIFGICRGLQTLNVHFGGSLKNVDSEPTSYQEGQPVHALQIDGKKYIEVSSNHHQAIDRLASDFEAIAYGYEVKKDSKTKESVVGDKLNIEVIRHTRLPIAAVQFHPEKNFVAGSCKASLSFSNSLLMSLFPNG